MGFIEIKIIESPKIQLRTQEQFSVFNEILRSKNKNFRRLCVFHYIQKNLKYCNLLECNIFFGISVDKTERDDSETNKN